MVYNIIKTGSDGNSVGLLNNTILVDIGVPFKDVEPILEDIKYIVITHRHGDHLNKSTLRRVVSLKPLIRVIIAPYLYEAIESIVPADRIDVINQNVWYMLNDGVKMSTFNLYHNVDNIGLRVYKDDYKIFYATDTYTLEGIEAKNYTHYLVERNYCEDVVADILEKASESGEFTYVKRSMENHLSKQKLELWLVKNNKNNGEVVYLHESDVSL